MFDSDYDEPEKRGLPKPLIWAIIILGYVIVAYLFGLLIALLLGMMLSMVLLYVEMQKKKSDD